MTQVSYGEFLGAPDCLVKNTVALQEAENGAPLCSMEIANKPRSINHYVLACFGTDLHAT